MMSLLIEHLAGHDNKIFFWSYPVVSLLNKAESNNQVRVKYPQRSADYGLLVFEDKLNTDCYLIVVLVLIDRRVVAVFIGIRPSVVPDADIVPAKALCEF